MSEQSKQIKQPIIPTPLKHVYPNISQLPIELSESHKSKDSDTLIILNSFITWKPSWSPKKDKWLKLPSPHTNKTKLHKSLPEIMRDLSPDKGLGLVFNSSHNYIALDIDNIPLDNQDLNDLLSTYPTYIEASPSGQHKDRYRALFKLSSAEDKQLIKAHPTHQYNPKASKANDRENKQDIELFSSSGYCTLTGEAISNHPYFSQDIAEVPIETILMLWPSFATTKEPQVPRESIPSAAPSNWNTPISNSITKPEIWLKMVSLDPNNLGCQILMDKMVMTHREYWVTGLMALHAALGPIQGLIAGEIWSKSHEDSFDQESFDATWNSISPDEKGITVATYEMYYKQFMPDWPVRTKTGGIVHIEYENFTFFLDFLGLVVTFDNLTQSIFFDGPSSILYPKLYKDKTSRLSCSNADLPRLEAELMDITRLYKFRPKISDIQQHLTVIINKAAQNNRVNRFAHEISLVKWDGKDRIHTLANNIIIREPRKIHPTQEFHETLIRKWLYTITRYYWPGEMKADHLNATAEGMLILSSEKGGIGKSHFTHSLFPNEWSHLQITQEPRFNNMSEDKDYLMKVCVCAVNNLDEAENAFHNNNESSLKQYMTTRIDCFRAPYGRHLHFYPRMHALYASTNKSTLPIPTDGGHRRYWWLNVSYVDTYKLDAMDLMQLWAQVKLELTQASKKNHVKNPPWLLTSSERDYLGSYILAHRATNSMTELIHDTYETEEAGFTKKIKEMDTKELTASQATCTVSDIATTLGLGSATKALRNTVTDLLRECAPKEINRRRYSIINGIYITGRQTRFFMPVLRSKFDAPDLMD